MYQAVKNGLTSVPAGDRFATGDSDQHLFLHTVTPLFCSPVPGAIENNRPRKSLTNWDFPSKKNDMDEKQYPKTTLSHESSC